MAHEPATQTMNKSKPKKWRSHATAKQAHGQEGKSVKQSKSSLASKSAEEGVGTGHEIVTGKTPHSKQQSARPSTDAASRRTPFSRLAANNLASDSEESDASSDGEQEKLPDTSHSKFRKNKREIAFRRTGTGNVSRDRLRKQRSTLSRPDVTDKSLLAPETTQTAKENRELSFVTDGGASSMAHNDQVPRASSPIMAVMSPVSGDGVAIVKAGSPVNLDGKQHRGIVAEMHAHERRQARLAGQANKQASNAASRLLDHLRSSAHQQAPSSLSADLPIDVPPSTYYPYGIPTVPNTEAVLSPYGLSPYAEPGSSWTTNVYVNNLPPHTTDDDLFRLGSCFGRVKSHKAIINQDTGLCKGYGFIMYEFLHDAELAIQQLPLHGLSTSWAKESFSSKLRRMADSTTSNVYLSNLPHDISPAKLEQLFLPHHVVSLRILTDPSTGKTRGVGFVRLRDRTVAQECIERLNGMVIPGQDSPLQARYADSEAQKQFKLCARAQLGKCEAEEQESLPFVGEANATQNTASNAAVSQPAFVAALQGQQAWTGFPTPASTNSGFSPLLGVMSPQTGISGFPGAPPPQLAPLGHSYGLDPASYYSAAALESALSATSRPSSNDPFDPLTAHRLQWLAAAQRARAQQTLPSAPSRAQIQGMMMAGGATSADGGETRSSKVRATYLPPDLAMQHARALMEKNMQMINASSAASIASHLPKNALLAEASSGTDGLTQQHVENERADLLKLLKERSDHMVRMQNEAEANRDEESGTLGLTLDGQHPAHQRSDTQDHPVTRQEQTLPIPRRFTNPCPSLDGTTNEPPQASLMRPSLSAASLSPLRFLYSHDPRAPISVEAIDVARISTGDFKSSPKSTASNGGEECNGEKESLMKAINKDDQSVSPAEEKSILMQDHLSTMLDDDNQNTTADSGDVPPESSYTSANTSNRMEDSNVSVGSATSMRKSDSGKDFTCHRDFDKAIELEDDANVSPLLLGMITTAGSLHERAAEPKRVRSKSVLIQVPPAAVPQEKET